MSEIPFYPDEYLQRHTAESSLRDRVRDLESELERIRPVYEAACAWRDMPGDCRQGAQELIDAVDAARSPR